jgi:hypothetical protein
MLVPQTGDRRHFGHSGIRTAFRGGHDFPDDQPTGTNQRLQRAALRGTLRASRFHAAWLSNCLWRPCGLDCPARAPLMPIGQTTSANIPLVPATNEITSPPAPKCPTISFEKKGDIALLRGQTKGDIALLRVNKVLGPLYSCPTPVVPPSKCSKSLLILCSAPGVEFRDRCFRGQG